MIMGSRVRIPSGALLRSSFREESLISSFEKSDEEFVL